MILTLKKLGTERNRQAHSQQYSQWWKTESCSFKSGTKRAGLLLPVLFQHSTESLRKNNYQEKEIPNRKGRSKNIFAHRWYDLLCVVQSLSRVRLFVTPMDCSMPGFHVHHQLSELAQTQFPLSRWCIEPSHLLSSPSPLAFSLSQHQGLFQ